MADRSVIQRLMSEHESLTLKKRYIINSIDDLVLEDRLTVLRIIESIDREKIKTLSVGTAYNLDNAPQGLIDVLSYTIERLLKQGSDMH
jgi:hypothetical protein